MTIQLLAILIFVVTLVLVLCGIYFFIEAPAAKRKMRARLDTAKMDLITSDSGGLETDLLRAEVLSDVPGLHRLLIQIPGVQRLNLFIQQSATQITVGMLLTISFLAAWLVFLACLALNVGWILALVMALLSSLIPFLVIAVK